MSLFRPESVRLGIDGRQISILRVAGFTKPRVMAEAIVPLEELADLGTLSQIFESAPFKHGPVHITIADRLVRYFVVAPPSGLRSISELSDVVNARFEEQFGLSSNDWEISTDLECGRGGLLACAAPRSILDPLRQMLAHSKRRLASVKPFAVSELNHWRARLPGRDFWFAAMWEEGVALSCRGTDGWAGFRFHERRSDAPEDLSEMMDRDAMRHGMARAPMIYCAGTFGQPAELNGAAGRVNLGAGVWPGQSLEWARHYRLALSGVWP